MVPLVLSPTRMSRPRPVDFAGTTIRIPGLSGPPVLVQPHIEQRCEFPAGGFADADVLREPPTYEFSCYVDVESPDAWDVDHEDADRIRAHLPTFAVAHGPTIQRGGRLLIGHLRITPYPERVRQQLGESWFNWLDSRNGDAAQVGECADRIVEDLDGVGIGALLDGSLLHCESLEVHPAFAGQDIGLRLLAHGLWAVGRSVYDVAILSAAPIVSRFASYDGDESRPATNGPRALRAPVARREAAVQRLVRHYARLGFQRVYPVKTPRSKGDGIPMYFSSNWRMNVTGLDE